MAKKAMTFDAAMARLEEVVARMEAGDLELEQALTLYEEGIGLVRACSEKLENAQQKMQKLRMGEASVTLEPFCEEEQA